MSDDYLINFRATGTGEVVSAASQVSQAVGGVDTSAGTAAGGLGNFGTSLANLVGRAAVVGVALKAVSFAMDEIAENEKAEETLRKAGVAAADMASAMEALDDLELFTGDKLSAAQLYGNVLNGRTAELKRYGIELSATATMEQRLAAIQELRNRGLANEQARIGTVTGELARMGRGLGDLVGKLNEATGFSNLLGGALQWVNENLIGIETRSPQAVKKVVESFKAAEVQVQNVNAALSQQLSLIGKIAEGLGNQKGADRRIFDATLEKDVAEGRVSPQDAERKKAERDVADAESSRQSAANDAERVKALVQQERERINRELSDANLRRQADADAGGGTVRDFGEELRARQEQIRKSAQQEIEDNRYKLGGKSKAEIENQMVDDLKRAESQVRTERDEIARKSDENLKKLQEDRSKALQELSEAESKALRELQQRDDEARAARAEYDAKLAKIEREEAEQRRADGQRREEESKKNNDEKLKAAEAEAERRKKQAEAARQLSEEIAKREEQQKAAGEEPETDRNGRRKIRSKPNTDTLPPLPQRKQPDTAATEKVADAATDGGQSQTKALETAANAITAAAQKTVEVTSGIVQQQEAFQREMDSLSRRMKANT